MGGGQGSSNKRWLCRCEAHRCHDRVGARVDRTPVRESVPLTPSPRTRAADGWDVHITQAEDVVVRTVGKRITVAIIPDDDDTPAQPLEVAFAAPESVTA